MLLGTSAGNARIKRKAGVKPVEDPGGAAYVIALRMSEHDQRQVLHTEPPKLTGDVGFWRSFVDQHGSSRNLEEHAIALADIEKRDAEAMWRR